MKTKLTRSQEVVWQELDGQALLVHTQTGARWTLNAAALAIWQLCDGTHTLESLAQALATKTRKSARECRQELEQFAQTMMGTGLFQCAELAGQPAHFSTGTLLSARYQGMSLIGARKRPSPRGNSGPG